METPPKYSKQEIEEAFHAECPYFYELQQKVQQTDNGVIGVQVRKYKGKLQDWVITVSTKNKVQ